MKFTLHKADSRGYADHGWLKAKHSFSFANYHNPEKIHFGLLRVLNDDIVSAGMGFGTHPHDNMEIVTIPLKGELAHKDSTGNKGVIRVNDVQIMSAGSGITHSEFNNSDKEEVNLLQIWVFPLEKNIKPRYDQKTFNKDDRINIVKTLVSPEKNKDSLWINQNAYFSLCTLQKNKSVTYNLNKPGNGIYIFLIEGEVNIEKELLKKRDAIGIEEAEKLDISANEESEILFIEVPMR